MDHGYVARHLVAHRGYWRTPVQQNSPEALQEALNRGFGFETDLRDLDGQLVLSHDPPRAAAAVPATTLIDTIAALETRSAGPLALNVKSDGLVPLLSDLTDRLAPYPYFLFDMTFPQTLTYARHGLPLALRVSEFEPVDRELAARLDLAPRWWLDAFDSDWWLEDGDVHALVEDGEVHIVSPEIHGRDPQRVWNWFGTALQAGRDVYLCTDRCDDVLEALT